VNEFLSMDELADLVGCKVNQRAIMARWLDDRRWRYVLDRHERPKVAREFFNKKMGISDEPAKSNLTLGPDLSRFA
jgi:Domain of unknown function (DUF4224)